METDYESSRVVSRPGHGLRPGVQARGDGFLLCSVCFTLLLSAELLRGSDFGVSLEFLLCDCEQAVN